MRKTTLSLMITTLVFSGAAISGDKDEHKAEVEARTSGSAELSIGSVRTMGSATVFSKLDANTDGQISTAEAEAMNGLPQQWSKLDADGNGALSMTEFAALSENSSGTRGDGNNAVDAEIGVETETGVAGSGIGSDPGGEAEAVADSEGRIKIEDISRSNAVQAFNRVDADGDFKLNEDEAANIEGLDSRFAELDQDGDGALDYAEFNAVTQVETERR